jgi:hypothetical protein
MRALRIAIVSLALILGGAAHADRVFDLDGIVKVKVLGESFSDFVTGTLTLHDDGTYTLNAEGDVATGFWLEEKGIQLFQEDPGLRDTLEAIEEDLSEGAGFGLRVTSVIAKEKVKRGKTGDIAVKSKTTYTIRPVAFEEGRAIKVTESVQLIGLLK